MIIPENFLMKSAALKHGKILFLSCSPGEEKEQPEVFEFDHIYPGSEYGALTAILYGALGSPCFERLHTLLADASKDVSVLWRVSRHIWCHFIFRFLSKYGSPFCCLQSLFHALFFL